MWRLDISCSIYGDLILVMGVFGIIYSKSRALVSWNSLISGHTLTRNYHRLFSLH